MENVQKILQPVKFILAWTLLWIVVIGCAGMILYNSSTEGLNLTTLKKIADNVLKVLPASLFGSFISYFFLHHWFPRLQAKRIFLGLFWAAFWNLCLLNLMTSGSQPEGMGNSLAVFLYIFIMFGAVFFLGPIIIGIAYFASFAPILRPQNYRDGS